MAMQREIKKLADVLADEHNATMTAEGLAEIVIDALDNIRAESHRFVSVVQVVGHNGPSRPYVVGPWSTFKRALEGGQRGVRQITSMDSAGFQYRQMVGMTLPAVSKLEELYEFETRNKLNGVKTYRNLEAWKPEEKWGYYDVPEA